MTPCFAFRCAEELVKGAPVVLESDNCTVRRATSFEVARRSIWGFVVSQRPRPRGEEHEPHYWVLVEPAYVSTHRRWIDEGDAAFAELEESLGA